MPEGKNQLLFNPNIHYEDVTDANDRKLFLFGAIVKILNGYY